MNNKILSRIILSALIIVAFFLPWFSLGNGSALDIVLAKNQQEETVTAVVRYSFLLIPFFALLVLLLSISNKSSHFLLRLLPFLVTAILSTLFIIGISSGGGENIQFQAWFSILGYGYFITLVASLILVFV